jgi:uncharacterized membrane protein
MAGRHGHTAAGGHGHLHGHGAGGGPLAVWVLAAALVPFAVAAVVGLVVLWPARHDYAAGVQSAGGGRVAFERGVVIEVDSQPCGAGSGPAGGVCVSLQVQLDTGPEAGHAVTVPVGNAGSARLREGDRVRLGRVVDPGTGKAAYLFDDVLRTAPLAWLAGLFAVVVVAVARWRGLAALAGLAVTYLVLVAFVLPALLDGRSPVAVGLVAAAVILFVVLYLAHGVSARTSAALLGTLLSLGLTGLLAWAAIGLTKLTGLSAEQLPYLQAAGARVSVTGLLLCGLVIGTLGVLNDATVTQASAVWELSAADPAAGPLRLYRSAMRIGRDHIASTIYTLVLAYAGSALPVLLLFSVSGRSTGDVLTGDEIAGEIVRGLVGGVGIAASVPITTAVAAAVVAAALRRAPVGEPQPDPDVGPDPRRLDPRRPDPQWHDPAGGRLPQPAQPWSAQPWSAPRS